MQRILRIWPDDLNRTMGESHHPFSLSVAVMKDRPASLIPSRMNKISQPNPLGEGTKEPATMKFHHVYQEAGQLLFSCISPSFKGTEAPSPFLHAVMIYKNISHWMSV